MSICLAKPQNHKKLTNPQKVFPVVVHPKLQEPPGPYDFYYLNNAYRPASPTHTYFN
jgi:hypothetical protein